MEEQELADLCRQGDNRARKELYERYAGRMQAICLRYSSDRDTAQDLLHDGFIKIYHSFDKFTWRGEGSLRAWMERVIINTALQLIRKNDVMSLASTIDDSPEPLLFFLHFPRICSLSHATSSAPSFISEKGHALSQVQKEHTCSAMLV